MDVGDTGLNRCREPVSKLFDRIAVEIAPAQTLSHMLVTRSIGISRRLHMRKVAHASRLRNAKSPISDKLVPWRRGGLRNNGFANGRHLTQLLDYFWNDFNRAIDLRVTVEPATRKAQTPSGAIAAWIHCSQHVRSFL